MLYFTYSFTSDHFTVDSCFYLLSLCKMENNEFKNVRIKNGTCYYFVDIIKLEDFDLGDILIDKK